MATPAEALVEARSPARPQLRLVVDAGPVPRRRPGAVARRRVAVLALVAVVAFAGGLLAATAPGGAVASTDGGAATSAHERGAAPSEPVTVVVSSGDTVWGIAREHLPAGREPSAYVGEILAENDLDPTALQPGTVVRLPPP